MRITQEPAPAAWYGPLPGGRVKDACGAAVGPFDPPARSRGMQAQARLSAWVEQDGQRLSVVVQARLGRRDRVKGCARGGCRWPCADYRADAGYAAAGARPTGDPARCSGRPNARHAGPACAATAWPRPGDPDGWLSQPWLEPRCQEQHRWSEDYAREAAEWEEGNWLVASMPPDVRVAYDAAQKASHDQLYQALELSAVELEVLCLDQMHEQVLTAAGKQVRIIAARRRPGGCSGRPRRRTASVRHGRDGGPKPLRRMTVAPAPGTPTGMYSGESARVQRGV